MLTGIDPILTGALLAQLDAMGHSDAVVVADAHFPAATTRRTPSSNYRGSPLRPSSRPSASVIPLD